MKRGTLEYPYTAARSICELTKADKAIELVVENVQQQNGGNDFCCCFYYLHMEEH